MDVIVIGSSNVDYTLYVDSFPKPGETILGGNRIIAPGGKGANQAIAAHRAGAETRFITALGNDSDGAFLLGVFEKEGLSARILDKEESTGNALIMVNRESENMIVVIGGANQALNEEDVLSCKQEIESTKVLVIQNEIPTPAIVMAARIAHEAGVKTIYNPAPMKPMPNELFGYIDLITPNQSELDALAPNGESLESKMSEVLDMGAKSIIVTLGEEGSIYFDGHRTIRTPSFRVKAVDTVGAGDTFNGYLAASISKGTDIEAAIHVATKAAAISATRKGAIPSIPTKEEVQSSLF